MYSYVINLADSESDLGWHDKPLISIIFTIYHLLENDNQNVVVVYILIKILSFDSIERFESIEGFERFKGFTVHFYSFYM